MEWIFKFTYFVISVLLFLVELSHCKPMFNIPFNRQALDLHECCTFVNLNGDKSLELAKLRSKWLCILTWTYLLDNLLSFYHEEYIFDACNILL